MPRALPAEISMRHFPDASDASLEIPAVQYDILMEADFELAYDAFDENTLGALDVDPFTTPMPKSKHHAPLTLSEITPRREITDHRATSNADISDLRLGAVMPKLQQQSVRAALPKKESCDDMFERRKRDSYQQMGIDLTSKSTARLRCAPDEAAGNSKDPDLVAMMKPPGGAKIVTRGNAKDGSKAKAKRPAPRDDAGIVKHKPRVPSSSSTQHIQPKSILKPSKPTETVSPSTLSGTAPKAERPNWVNVVAEVQRTDRGRNSGESGMGTMGGGLIDVLVMYGEKLKGSLGFSSGDGLAIAPNDVHTAPTKDSPHMTSSSMEVPGCQPQNTTDKLPQPLTLSDLGPSHLEDRQRYDLLTLSQLSPSQPPPAKSESYKESSRDERRHLQASPIRPSTKRTSTGSPKSERKKGKMNPEPPSQPPESSKTAIERINPRIKAAMKPKVLGPSHAANGVPKRARAHTQPSSISKHATSAKPRLPTVSGCDLKGKRIETSNTKLLSRRAPEKEQHGPPSLTLPSPFAVTSDASHQQNLVRAQAEREKTEEQENQKGSFKASTKPYFSKPAPPARTTVPAAFNFKSDARVAQRHANFEEKRKTWESRATPHALPMPDFVAIHAAQAEVEAARVRRNVPVLPTDAPLLTTMARAKERERFEEERRAREREIERLGEMRERERAEQEEREYREARKRTVPKAHEVPEWYKDVPKRREGR